MFHIGGPNVQAWGNPTHFEPALLPMPALNVSIVNLETNVYEQNKYLL